MSPRYRLIRFDGLVDISRYPEFRETFTELDRSVPVLVDLADAEGVDSVFLSEMLLAKRRHAAPFVAVIPPVGGVARVFAITGLSAKPYMFSDLSKAIASMGVTPETDVLSAD